MDPQENQNQSSGTTNLNTQQSLIQKSRQELSNQLGTLKQQIQQSQQNSLKEMLQSVDDAFTQLVNSDTNLLTNATAGQGILGDNNYTNTIPAGGRYPSTAADAVVSANDSVARAMQSADQSIQESERLMRSTAERNYPNANTQPPNLNNR